MAVSRGRTAPGDTQRPEGQSCGRAAPAHPQQEGGRRPRAPSGLVATDMWQECRSSGLALT